LHLWPFLGAIAHSFGVPVWFTKAMTLSIVLRGMTKNSSFLRIRAVFVSYCPLFWGSGVIYTKYDIPYILERDDKKTHHFCILWPFSWAIAHSFGVPRWFTRSLTPSICFRGMTKNSSFFAF
jgi:hypothetical protein